MIIDKENYEPLVFIEWMDSYGVRPGWTPRDDDYKPSELTVESIGWIISETDTMIALSPNKANATEDTPLQDNGVMVIPKCSIKKYVLLTYDSASSGLGLESEQKQQQI